jgi:mRNA interferase MazF
VRRGEIWWARLPRPLGSGPGYPRPVLIVQSDRFNASGIQTAVVAAITKNTALAEAPGNVLVGRRESGLKVASVVNVSSLLSVDRTLLDERVAQLPARTMSKVDEGLRLALAL